MKLGEHIRLKSLLEEAKLNTKHLATHSDVRTFATTETWKAVRLICEALLEGEDA